MSLTTLAELKAHLGIASTDTSEDTTLSQILRGVSSAVRKYKQQYIGGVITSNSVAAATVVTAPGHGLETGNTIVVSGSNSTPTIDGSRVVTRLTADTFSIPVTVTVAGTSGAWKKQYTEYYGGNGKKVFQLNQRPVSSITSLYYDSTAYFGTGSDPFNSSTLLTEGTDYVLVRENANESEVSLKGWVAGINRIWYRPHGHAIGQLSDTPGMSLGNIKVTYIAGWTNIPDDWQLAVHQWCAIMRRIAPIGQGVVSEHYDDYQYTLDPAADRDNMLGGVRQLLGGRKPVFG